ncbi:MAG: DUF1326 domain-containing protein [Planctomycetaceae bacterium]|nr:DUF1326 domain-containing protein [Planctomycetaceae bacterium]MBV8607903.1 DUF1326 domain-containing protein [Singulisphaera sp.]
MVRSLTALLGAFGLVCSGVTAAADVQGDYVEARTADVFTGPCFSNAEVFVSGNQAVMAWKVTEGSYQGVDLRGLSVAAAVRGTTTFSADTPDQACSVLIVDAKADARQRDALIAMAKALGGARLSHVVDVKTATIALRIEPHSMVVADTSAHAEHGMPQAARASFWAAGLAQIVTRPLDERDHFCGNEVVAYPPLSRGVTALPAYTLGHQFKGNGLNVLWDDPNCRSSFVGHFAL